MSGARAKARFITATALVATVATWSYAQESPSAGEADSSAAGESESEGEAAEGVDAEGEAGAPAANAEPTKEQCIEAHRQSQQAQQTGRLVEARQLAITCTHQVCPGLLIEDCARWLEGLTQRTPSVVFEVRVDGQPTLEAEIWADETPVVGWTTGEAHLLDPGTHTFRFVLPPHEEVVHTVVLSEGMRFRAVVADFKTTTAEPPAPTTPPPAPEPDRSPVSETYRPVPVPVYPLLGVGALGLAGFTGFGLAGQSKQNDLESSCAPDCTDDDLSPMRRNYLLADLSLGVGVAGLVGATIVYLGRPERSLPSSQVGFMVLPGGAAATLTVRGH